MAKVSMTMKDIFHQRAVPIIENFLATEGLFEDLERDEMVEVIFDTFLRNCSPEELQEMAEEILSDRIRRILGGQVLYGLISDFTPEEMEEFDAAVRDMRKMW
ncbi:MAG: hypothetical protein F6K40_38895 [Okeania sp. SIO3I5]|uniref:hypothetical protein n=1 Tax=Okeania sp. SIO3I5 TaxID=2607805 RepID=UPI0013B61C5D|nr:hypothetical protein [Okeania sp. SIO3I5]NEQ41831.1 hypothetical protein [Okeania sp. SIO3I5]